MLKTLILFSLIVLFSCETPVKQEDSTGAIPAFQNPQFQGMSMLSDSLISPIADSAFLAKCDSIQNNYTTDPTADNLIWHARFTAYKGYYIKAIELYTYGIEQFPEDPRFLRHRGHRFISIRNFDAAIEDLIRASQMIEGTENEIEPDGAPNALNIPISSLHGNIYYHLGLAYYLKQDWENALKAYERCLAATRNDDNVVSSTHWLYMISQRMGKENPDKYLESIEPDMNIIENHAYHRACLFYKGLLTEEELLTVDGAPSSNDAIIYAVGNWHFYNGNQERAREIYEQIISGKSWNSFGYIAAEADMFYEFSE